MSVFLVKLPLLIAKLAPFDGRATETLAHIARVIREQGYISTTKRGSGAADMTTSDAANLLIAINASEAPKDAAAAVEHFRALPNFGANWKRVPHLESHAIFGTPTFGKALEKIIDRLPYLIDDLRAFIKADSDEEDQDSDIETLDRDFLRLLRTKSVGLEIKFLQTTAHLELYTEDLYGDRRTELSVPFVDWFMDPTRAYKRDWADRDIAVSIGLPTLMAVWFALHPDETIGGISESSLQWMRNLKGERSPIVARR